MTVPRSPTSQTSSAVRAQTENRLPSPTPVHPPQREPFHRSTVPPAPTTQISLAETAATSSSVLPWGRGFSQHQPCASQIGSNGLLVSTQVRAAPHTPGAAHVPHVGVRLTPQVSVSVSVPQRAETDAQSAASVSAMHPQTEGSPPPPQVSNAPQPPHSTSRRVPQRSLTTTGPHSVPDPTHSSPSDSSAQPHRFAVPPSPHTRGDAQVPHVTSRLAPQRSTRLSVPQFALASLQSCTSV